jgi:TonB family protein
MNIGVKSVLAWDEWQGRVVGKKFRLLKYLGGSERSAVFLTERQDARKNAAIKLVPVNDMAADAQLARWEASASLSHPNLIRLFETGRAQLGGASIVYVLMDYAEEDLSGVDRPLTEEEALDMLACKLSSDTIRATGDWSSDLDPRQRYDPPEIVDQKISAASDVWSLGVTLVEATTKHLPSWETSARAASLPDDLPGLFRVPVLNCLRRDPQQRWTVTDFATFLRRNVETSLPPREDSPATKVERRRYLMPAGAVGLTLVAAGIAVPRLISNRNMPPAPIAETAGLRPGPAADQPTAEDRTSQTRVQKPPEQAVLQDVVKQVLPDVPPKARNTIRGKVTVNIRVGVDDAGAVVNVKNESPASSRFFANLALKAARQWRFAPASPSSLANSREWTLRFQFVRDPRRPVSVQANR